MSGAGRSTGAPLQASSLQRLRSAVSHRDGLLRLLFRKTLERLHPGRPAAAPPRPSPIAAEPADVAPLSSAPSSFCDRTPGRRSIVAALTPEAGAGEPFAARPPIRWQRSHGEG